MSRTGLQKPQVLGRQNGSSKYADQDDSGPDDDTMMCSLCYAMTSERCNNGCGGVVPVCGACKRQGKTCAFCDDMRAFGQDAGDRDNGKGRNGDRSDDSDDGRRGRKKGKKNRVVSAQDSSSEDEEEGLCNGEEPSRSSRGGRSKKTRSSADGEKSSTKWWLETCFMAGALFIIGIALAYIMAPEQVTAGAKALESSLDFGGDDSSVITRAFAKSVGNDGCPPNTIHVTDRQACETAATFLSRRWGSFVKTAGPEGCYTKGFNVFFNSRQTKTLVEDPQVNFVCELGVVYGESGTNACPSESKDIMNEDMCKASGLAMGHAWDSIVNVATKPRGCYVQEELVTLNVHATGAPNEEAKPICVHKEGSSRAP